MESRLTNCAVNLTLLLLSKHDGSNVQGMGVMGTAYSILIQILSLYFPCKLSDLNCSFITP